MVFVNLVSFSDKNTKVESIKSPLNPQHYYNFHIWKSAKRLQKMLLFDHKIDTTQLYILTATSKIKKWNLQGYAWNEMLDLQLGFR